MENKQIQEPTLDSVLRRIERSGDDEIGAVISALIRRYRIVYPGWELLFLTIPADTSGKRGQAIEDIVTFLKKYTHKLWAWIMIKQGADNRALLSVIHQSSKVRTSW